MEQKKFLDIEEKIEKLETLCFGLFNNSDLCYEFLNDEEILQSIESLIQIDEINSELDQNMEKYKNSKKILEDIDQKRNKHMELLMKLEHIQNINNNFLINYIKENKNEIYKSTLDELENIILQKDKITSSELNLLYSIILKKKISSSIFLYLNSI